MPTLWLRPLVLATQAVGCPTRPWSRQAPQRRLRLKVKDVGMADTAMKRFLMRLLAIVGCLMAVCAVLFMALAWRFDQPPFDLARLNDLQTGMTPEQVRDVLGSPSSTHDRSWAYSGWMSWPIVYINFDESGRFSSHRYDY